MQTHGTPTAVWGSWSNVAGGTAALGSPVTAIARDPYSLDLFVHRHHGLIYSIAAVLGKSAPPPTPAVQGTPITVVTRRRHRIGSWSAATAA
jgi:hypothetical protein